MAVASDGGEDHGGEVRGRRRRLRGLRHVREDESESRPVRQCDAVWCDAVWCDAVQCSAVRCAVWLLPTTDLWRRVGRQVVEHAEDVEGPCGSTQWGLEPHSCRLQLAAQLHCTHVAAVLMPGGLRQMQACPPPHTHTAIPLDRISIVQCT
jgi:hypothetical protein